MKPSFVVDDDSAAPFDACTACIKKARRPARRSIKYTCAKTEIQAPTEARSVGLCQRPDQARQVSRRRLNPCAATHRCDQEAIAGKESFFASR